MRHVMDSFTLNGRTALVTGACGFLGPFIARTLAQQGARVLLLWYHEEGKIAGELWLRGEVPNIDMAFHRMDFLRPYEDSESDLVEFIESHGARVDILVNNAAATGKQGYEGWAVPFERQSLESMRKAMTVNLLAPIALTQTLAPYLKKERGAVLNIGSINGLTGPDNGLYEGTGYYCPAGYAATKAGLIHMTKYLACALAPHVRVNCLTPGGIYRSQAPDFVEKYNARVPLGRMATEEDYCGAVAFLCSDASSYMTGANLVIDGGWTAP